MKRCLAGLAFSGIIALAGCAGGERITVHSLFAECPRPKLSPLPALDPALHIGSAENVGKLLAGIDTLDGDIERLSIALDCYEAQTRKPDAPGEGHAGRK